jgi:hypothetical protein
MDYDSIGITVKLFNFLKIKTFFFYNSKGYSKFVK